MTTTRFIHLRVHSDYSMIDGIAKINQLVKQAAQLKMPALGITEFTNLCSLIKFYIYAHNFGIKPIIGTDFLVQSDILSDSLAELTILAVDNIGYKNLILLISAAYQRGYGASGPVIDRDWLINHNKGLIILSGARKGDIGIFLLRGNMHKVEKCLSFYSKYFPSSYYLEIMRTGRADEERYLHAAVDLAKRKSLPVVATNDVRFININDFDTHEIRVAIHDGFTLQNDNRPNKYSPQQYMRSEDQMVDLFQDLPEALANSVEIARRCNVTLRLGEYFLPQVSTGSVSTQDYLIKCSHEGLEKRLSFLFKDKDKRLEQRRPYDQRLDAELQVINQMGFPGYFLIVMDFVQWSKNNGIPVGPGRGSGAGSLVAYALRITDIDPISFDLIFERFLNPERISMPDFDIDFCMEQRDRVLLHVADTYGREAVSQIITFGTMTAKAAIRDVGRALGYSYTFVNRISKLVPLDPGITLEKAFIYERKLQDLYDTDEKVKKLIDMARKLEGVIRNAGKHAGGVVIAPTKITDFSPLYCDSEGSNRVTQFDKNDVEYTGLVKFDFLGLRTLTVIKLALDMINSMRQCHKKNTIDIMAISLEDKQSFDMLLRSETTAVFQLESSGMKDLIKRLQPDCFEDMIALVALFRPGPLQSGMVDNFINRKHGTEAISYPDMKWQHESLKSILEPTYGIILYQEQVMQIAQVLAGYTLGEADILRRAMGKKKPEEMIKQRSKFKSGAEKQGISGELAMKIFDLVEKFAGYGFNKSHSAAYALISYQTLWLKAHYPNEFMAAAMSADIDNNEKIVYLIKECWRMSIKVLSPNINICEYQFKVNKNRDIMYGLGAIKGVGEGIIKSIITARNKDGKFHELFELCLRLGIKKLNRRVLRNLIMSGACDELGDNRGTLMRSLMKTIQAADQHTKSLVIGQNDMFGMLVNQYEEITLDPSNGNNIPNWSEQILLNGEMETLGLYLSGHPINQYLPEIKFYTRGLELQDIQATTDSNKIVTVAGIVISARVVVTKHGNKIGICTINDQSGQLDVILFANLLKKYHHLLEKDRILIFQGNIKTDRFNSTFKMIAHEIMDIIAAREKYVQRLVISLNNTQINYQFLNQLRLSFEPYRIGNIPVFIYYKNKNACVRLRLGPTWKIVLNDVLLKNLRTLVGNQQVKLEFD